MSGVPAHAEARAATWAVCVVSALAAAAMFLATGTAVAGTSLTIVGGLVLVPASLHLVYTRLRPDPFIGPVAGGLAALVWSGATAGLTALAALRTQAPLVDASLARADAVLGVHAPALVAWVALHPPLGAMLDVVYVSTVPAVFATVALLGWTGREAVMWDLCFAFAGSATICTLLSAFVPAAGAFPHYEMSPGVLARLPAGAGQYYLPVFDAYRSGALAIADIRHVDGVVSFPSFHAAMALMTAHAVRGVPRLLGPALAWCGLVLASTIPIGGHYVVDVLAGAVVWAGFALLPRARRALFRGAMAVRQQARLGSAQTRQGGGPPWTGFF